MVTGGGAGSRGSAAGAVVGVLVGGGGCHEQVGWGKAERVKPRPLTGHGDVGRALTWSC
jgi:hypothetical protein